MARDNGSRGCYRHTDATEQKVQQQQEQEQQQPRTPEKANTPLLDGDATPKATSTSNDLEKNSRPASHHPADPALDLLNAQFPLMSVPGAMPRRQTDFPRDFSQQRPAYSWKDAVIATVTYGSAAVGFTVIMWDGVKLIGGFLAEAGANLINDLMVRLGA